MAELDELVRTELRSFTPETLAELMQRPIEESLFFEFKAPWKPDDIAKSVCAFANREGGFLFLGATELNARLVKFNGLEPGLEYPRLAANQIVGHVIPTPAYDAVMVESPDVPGRPVLVMRVERSPLTPHFLDSGVVYRREPQASVPVADRSVIDALYERGRGVKQAVNARHDELQRTREAFAPLDDFQGWLLEVRSVPLPLTRGQYRHRILTERGFRSLSELLAATRLADLKARIILEHGAVLAGGLAQLAIFDDGAVVAWVPFSDQEQVGGRGFAVSLAAMDMVAKGVLGAQAALVPPVARASVRLRLIGIEGRGIVWSVDPRQYGSEGVFGSAEWEADDEVATGSDAVVEWLADIHRRMFRAVGDAGPHGWEPEPGG
jgi:hypothetical protein